MRRSFLYFTVILLCATNSLAQLPTRHSISSPRSKAAADLRYFDFQNFTYRMDGALVRISHGRGIYQGYGNKSFSYKVEKVNVAHGDLTGDNADEAAVTLYFTGGGTGTFSKGLLFTLRNGGLQLLTTFEGGDRADGGITEVRIEDGFLSVQRNEPERMKDVVVGLCCPKYLITTKYRWNGKGLVQVGESQKVEVKQS